MPSIKAIAQLDLNLLKTLEAIYQHRNMTRAAEVLNLTPSAVSHALKRLRESLDDPLFERRGSHMVPTPVCRQLLPELMNTLASLRQTLQSFGVFDPSTAKQTVRIAIHDALEALLLPSILTHFQVKAPQLKFLSVKLVRSQLEAQFEAGTVDFALDIARPLSAPVRHSRLSASEFCVLSSDVHFYHRELTEAVYSKAQHIAVSNRPTGKVLEDVAFARLGIERDIAVRCQHYYTAVQIIQDQPLLLTLPRLLGEVWQQKGLRLEPMPFKVPEVETHLYWHRNSEHDPLLTWVQEQLQSLEARN